MNVDLHLLSAGRETARTTVPRAVGTVAQRGRVCQNCGGKGVLGGRVVDIPILYYLCTSEVKN